MKYIGTRTEIAKEINIKRTTTVRIDLADADCYGLKSQKVLIDNGTFRDGTPYLIRAEIRAFCDEQKFTFASYGVCLSNSFGYYDMEEILTYANAPVIKTDSDVVIAIVDSKSKRMFTPVLLHTGKRVDAHCSTPLTFEDDDNDASAYMRYADRELVAEWYGIRKLHEQ